MISQKCGNCKWFEAIPEKKGRDIDGVCKSKRHAGERVWYVYSNAGLCFEGQLRHRECVCGGDPELTIDDARVARNSILDCYIRCPRCRRQTKCFAMPWLAWEAWDNKQLEDEQMSIFDMMEDEK